MKKTIIALIAATAIPVMVFAASDDDSSGRTTRLDRMTERLDLSDLQRDRIQVLLDEQRAEREAMHERMRADREAMREKMRAQMADVLTPEQQAKMQDLRAERRESRGEHRRGNGHGMRWHGKHHRGGRHGCEDDEERRG